MPWEKSFDVDDVVHKAMLLFWKQGYTDTSMAMLLDTTSLTKGSFYNSFGSKHDLFVQTLLHYDQDYREVILQDLAALPSPLGAIETFLNGIVTDTLQDKEKKGCFLVNTTLDLVVHSPDVQKIVTCGFGKVEGFFHGRILKGQTLGEISPRINPEKTAKSLLAGLVGIRVLGRGLYDEAALRAIADQNLKLLHL